MVSVVCIVVLLGATDHDLGNFPLLSRNGLPPLRPPLCPLALYSDAVEEDDGLSYAVRHVPLVHITFCNEHVLTLHHSTHITLI